MNALIAINSIDQDQELGVEFDRIMKDNNWLKLENVPEAYSKSFDESMGVDKIINSCKQNVDDAADEAEWEKLNYLITISENQPYIFSTK